MGRSLFFFFLPFSCFLEPNINQTAFKINKINQKTFKINKIHETALKINKPRPTENRPLLVFFPPGSGSAGRIDVDFTPTCRRECWFDKAGWRLGFEKRRSNSCQLYRDSHGGVGFLGGVVGSWLKRSLVETFWLIEKHEGVGSNFLGGGWLKQNMVAQLKRFGNNRLAKLDRTCLDGGGCFGLSSKGVSHQCRGLPSLLFLLRVVPCFR